jgi:hypothetical protein
LAVGDRIPPEETLYRSVSPDNIIGDRVLQDGVEMPNCSFKRASLVRGPEDALSADRPHESRVMQIPVRDLPPPITRETDQVAFEFQAIHLPEPGDAAHSEVRLTRRGGTFTRNIRKNQEFMDLAKDQLAACARVVAQN